jgi:flavodoxin I
MKTIVVYASMTGHTERIARTIAKKLTECGEDVEVKDAIETYADELISYERILIGSYTWGDGDLPDELMDFYEELKKTDLSGKIGAVFGAGDSTYTHFARAVDLLENTLTQQGCTILQKGLKVDQSNDAELEEECKAFILNLLT